MKKNNFKKIFIVFSLCVFLLSLFSVSSFALNISEAAGGYLYKFKGPLAASTSTSAVTIQVKGFLVDKTSGEMTPFSSLSYGGGSYQSDFYYFLNAYDSSNSLFHVVTRTGANYDVLIDYSDNTVSKSDVESIFSSRFDYTVSALSVPSIFNKVKMSLSGGTNGDGVAYDGLLGMISKFGNFLVSSPLLLVLCIALPLVSFSVGLIIRIKNRA